MDVIDNILYFFFQLRREENREKWIRVFGSYLLSNLSSYLYDIIIELKIVPNNVAGDFLKTVPKSHVVRFLFLFLRVFVNNCGYDNIL